MVQTARHILRCWNTKHTNWWTWISSNNCYSTFSTNINGLSRGLRKPGPFGNRNQNPFFDMCSSPKLLDNLLSQETYACLTVWLNRKELPPCSTMKLTEAREMVCQQWAKLLFTKWHDKRDISFLSTNVSTGTVMWKGRSKDSNSKTALESLYTLNMGGVDQADHLRSSYYVGWQSRIWKRYLVWFVFNAAVCNAHNFESIQQNNGRQLLFCLTLAKELIIDFAQHKCPAL